MQLIDSRRYVDYKVYSVTKIKDKYGFRIKLIYDDGTELSNQKSGYSGIRAATKERDRVIAELASGKYVAQEKIKVKEFFEYWLEKELRPRITNSSYNSYKNLIMKHIIPALGNIQLNLLNQGQIQEFYESEAKKYTSSFRTDKAIFDSAMKYAMNRQLISVNPTIGVRIPKSIKKKDSKVLKIDVQKTLTQQQLKVLINAAKGTKMYLHILFASMMGLRKGEICGLKYSDVDFTNRKLRVERQIGVKPNSKKEDFITKMYSTQDIPLKTKASKRELDIPDIVFEAILEQRKIYECNKKKRMNDKTNRFYDLGYICCSSYGRARSKTFGYRIYKELLKKNNLPDIRFHDLRATYATILIKNDFSLKAISKKMGHAKQLITIDVYGDKRELVKDCLDKLNPFLEEVLPKEKNITIIDLTSESEIIAFNMQNLIIELTKDCKKVKDLTNDVEMIDIINQYWTMI